MSKRYCIPIDDYPQQQRDLEPQDLRSRIARSSPKMDHKNFEPDTMKGDLKKGAAAATHQSGGKIPYGASYP